MEVAGWGLALAPGGRDCEMACSMLYCDGTPIGGPCGGGAIECCKREVEGVGPEACVGAPAA